MVIERQVRNMSEYISGSNTFNLKSFNKMCKALEEGKQIRVGIDCIGHTHNNYEQEAYKKSIGRKVWK